MKYCPICRKEYLDSDQSCVDHGPLTPKQLQSVSRCELCGRIVERGETACPSCGAKIHDLGWAGDSVAKASGISSAERAPTRAQWWDSDDEDAPPEKGFFRIGDSRRTNLTPKRTGVVLTVVGFTAGIAVTLMVMRNLYDGKPAPVVPVQQAGHPPPVVENLLPPELPTPQGKTLTDKSIADFSNQSIETEVLPVEPPLGSAENGGSEAKETQRRAAQANANAHPKQRVTEKSTAVSLKIPDGVRIPSPAELRRKRAQHEMEQVLRNPAIPGGVNIPSPGELRRKKVEHEVEQAIQIRAIEGVNVSVIGRTVYLTGQVETERQRAAAEQAARGIPDVGNIRSSISVRGTKG